MNKRVITLGTFDLLHKGHENIFKKCKEFGDYLIVVVSTDEGNRLKGKTAIQSEEERLRAVQNNPHVDLAILSTGDIKDVEELYSKYDIDLHVVGDDHKNNPKFIELNDKFGKVIFVPRTPGFSSTQKRRNINSDLREFQLKTLDLFKEVIHFFESKNISWVAHGGTVLGAVRHKGFIPWDDDVDVAIKYSDYIAHKEDIESFAINKGYELYDIFSEKNTSQALIKLVNPINGSFIDIMFLHSPNNVTRRKKLFIAFISNNLPATTSWTNWISYAAGKKKTKLLSFFSILTLPVLFIWRSILPKWYKQLKYKADENLIRLDWRAAKKVTFNLGSMIKLEFEGIMINVSSNYKEYLVNFFGRDYMTPPIEKKRIPKHIDK